MIEQTATRAEKPYHERLWRKRRVAVTRAICRALGNFVMTNLTMKVTVIGYENIPATGPIIVVFNHIAAMDPLLLGVFIKSRELVALSKEELSRNPLYAWIIWGWDAIPIRRGEMDLTALRRALDVLKYTTDGLLIAPEGHRQPEGMHDPKEGISMLATKTNAMIVPIGVTGTYGYLQNILHFRRTPVTINIGKPFRIKEGVTRKQYMQAAHEIMYRIAPLVAPELRGDYADNATSEMLVDC